MKEGWTYLINAAKWHYFRDSRSLCGKWMYLGTSDLVKGHDASPQNCRTCMNKLAKERAKKNRAASKAFSV
jgi:hypothetical protein